MYIYIYIYIYHIVIAIALLTLGERLVVMRHHNFANLSRRCAHAMMAKDIWKAVSCKFLFFVPKTT